MCVAEVVMPGQKWRFCAVVRNFTSGYYKCERRLSLVSNGQEVSNSLGLFAAAFVLACEGLAVILATLPTERDVPEL